MKNNKSKIVAGIIICAIVLISILGTYAFFLADLNETKEEVSVKPFQRLDLNFLFCPFHCLNCTIGIA